MRIGIFIFKKLDFRFHGKDKKIIACLVLMVALALVAPLHTQAVAAQEVTAREFARLLKEKQAVAVDVMSGLECRDHRIPGSLCIPAEEIKSHLGAAVKDKERRVIFYDDQGRRDETERALVAAKELGYSRASVFAGGLVAWKEAGFPVESADRIARKPSLSVNPDELKKWLAEGRPVFILDIRGEGAYGKDHIPGAVNIPMNLLDRRYVEVPYDRTIVVVDGRGLRSLLAASFLAGKGVKAVMRLRGGMERWNASGGHR